MTSNSRSRLRGVLMMLAVGHLFAPSVLAQTLTASLDGKGSAAVVPYYTVNDSWHTLLNVTNTTPNSLAVKVRFLEARNGRDVLNFVIALAPGDVWTGWLGRNEQGRPVLKTTDRSCTVPAALRDEGLVADEFAYSTPGVHVLLPGYVSRYADYSGTNLATARMREGYVEVLAMGEAVRDGGVVDVPWDADHVDGEPRDCGAVAGAFHSTTESSTGADGVIQGRDGSVDPEARGGSSYGPIVSPASLKVNASLVNKSAGTAAAMMPIHIRGWGVGRNLVSAQSFPFGLEPTLASHEGLWSTGGLAAVTDALAAVAVENEWTGNAGTGASTDWVLTFPTKRFEADESAQNIRAGCSRWRNSRTSGGVPMGEAGARFSGWTSDAPWTLVADAGAAEPERICPDLGFPEVFQEGNDGRAAIAPVRYRFRDRESQRAERLAVDEPSPSALPYAANVLPVGSGGPASALGSPIAEPLDSDALIGAPPHGWLGLDFPGDDGASRAYSVTGFVFKRRDFGNAELNFSQASPHARVRP